MNYSPPGSTVREILQARILEWVVMPSSSGSFGPRDWTWVSYISFIDRQVLYHQHHLGSPMLLLLFSHSVVSDSLQPHGLQHTRLPCPSPSPRVCLNSYPLSWCHPTISFSVIPFSSCFQSVPISESFPMSRLFASGGKPFSSVQFSSVMSDSLRSHESQHARPPCPSPTLGVHPNSCPSSQWCHPAISSSVITFSSCPQSFPASESFPMSQLFTSGGQILEFQLQHQSFQRTPRANLL